MMKRILNNPFFSTIILVTLLLNTSNALAFSWSDLWLRQDQQAEKAMNAGKMKQAAKLFKNKNWQGVANYRAGDYKAAYDNFKKNTSAMGYYNQGNALAQMGEYQKAIKAYDKALAQDSKMADAKFNKNLLKKLQKQQRQNKPQHNQSRDNNKKDNKQSSQSKNQSSQSKQQNNKKPPTQNQKNQQSPKNQSQNNQNQQQGNQQQTQSSQTRQQNKSQDQSQQIKQQAEKRSGKNQKNKNSTSTKPLSEEQQATEQWLRGIPDDPGGLLKQKFLRDHQTYQEKRQQGKASW